MLESIDHLSYAEAAQALARFEVQSALTMAGAVQTVPDYAVASIRVQILAHLALVHCSGDLEMQPDDVRYLIDRILGQHEIADYEDPIEDVFVSGVTAPDGTYRLIEGMWGPNDAPLQRAIECLYALPRGKALTGLVREIRALLTISEEICRRRNLDLWLVPDLTQPSREVIAARPFDRELLGAVRFTPVDLVSLRIKPEDLHAFVLTPQAKGVASVDPFEYRPLVQFDEGIVVASPSSISSAIRMRIISWAAAAGVLDDYERAIRTHQAQSIFETVRTDGGGALVTGPRSRLPSQPSQIAMHTRVFEIDRDKLAHVIVLHDDLASILDTGLRASVWLATELESAFSDYLFQSAEILQAQAGGGGFTLIAFAGLGREQKVGFRTFQIDGWKVAGATTEDMLMLLQDREWDMLRFWRMLDHETAVENRGIQIYNASGVLNLAAFWEEHGWSIVPATVTYSAENTQTLIIPTDYLRELRIRRRKEDGIHAVEYREGTALPVRRLVSKGYFKAQSERPVYAVADAARTGVLLGVVERPHLTLWVRCDARRLHGSARHWAYKIWEATITWMDVVSAALEVRSLVSDGPVHLDLTLLPSAGWEIDELDTLSALKPVPPSARHTGRRMITVQLEAGFLRMIAKPTNEAERAIVYQCVQQLCAVLGNIELHDIDQFVDACMGSEHARQMHVFQARSAADPLARGTNAEPMLVAFEERALWELGLAWKVTTPTNLDASSGDCLITDRNDAVSFLHKCVEIVWGEIEAILAVYDRAEVIRLALENGDEIARDRELWKLTARALEHMPTSSAEATEVAATREGRRAVASSACRTIVEMAVCACPIRGGRLPSKQTMAILIAGASLLLELATDADAIHGGPEPIEIRLRPAGYVEVEFPWISQVASPYVRASFDVGWKEAIDAYETRVATGGEPQLASESAPKIESPVEGGFDSAFEQEYGISPDTFYTIVAELIDWGTETEQSVLPVTREEILKRLSDRRGISQQMAEAFLVSFTLMPRSKWNVPPKGYTGADWQPWRFRRRLSLMARPLVLLDENAGSRARYLISVQQAIASMGNLVKGLRAGWFQQAYVSTKAMKSYLGAMANAHGAEFTQRVAEILRTEGWQVATEIKMTQLGASAELGDVDVLAWREGDSRFFCIECKRLRPARTVNEILEVLSRFRGQAKDLLARHLTRVNWLGANIETAAKRLKQPISDRKLRPLLVTNAVVPMQFVQELPLTTEDIVVIDDLASIIR